MSYETVWHGGLRDVYLCVPEPSQPVLRVKPCILPPPRKHDDHSAVKRQMFALLAERSAWRVRDLRQRLDVDATVLAGLIQRARAHREIRSVSYGRIALVRRRVSGEAA